MLLDDVGRTGDMVVGLGPALKRRAEDAEVLVDLKAVGATVVVGGVVLEVRADTGGRRVVLADPDGVGPELGLRLFSRPAVIGLEERGNFVFKRMRVSNAIGPSMSCLSASASVSTFLSASSRA